MSKCSVAEIIIYGGTIHSMDPDCPNPEAVAIAGGKIIGVGERTSIINTFAGAETKLEKLEDGEALLPGFIEPHSHCTQMVMARAMYISCSAYTYPTYDKVKELFLKTLTDIQVNDPNSWAIFLGWDPEMDQSLPQLTFELFEDEYPHDIPMLIVGQSGHVAWANRKAFDIAEISDDVVQPDGGTFVMENGKLTGQMFELAAFGMLLAKAPQPDEKELTDALSAQWKEFSAAGFTTATDLAYMPNPKFDPLIEARAGEDDCPIRVALYEMVSASTDDPETPEKETEEKPKRKQKHKKHIECCRTVKMAKEPEEEDYCWKESDKMWLSGIKLVGDGSPHCGTAAIAEPYLDTDITQLLGFPEEESPNGILNYEDEELETQIALYHGQGKQIAIHVHGERAVEQALRVFEKVQNASPKKDIQHRMEHLGLITEEHIEKAAQIGVTLSFFVEHLFFYASTYASSIFGAERTSRWAPVSLALKHNVLWTIHQDHPTFPGTPSPFDNLMTAVTRSERYKPGVVYGPQYRIPMKEALKGYTINAAKQIGKERDLGSLTVGKQADLVVVNADPVRVANVDPYNIDKIKVVGTYLKGRAFKHSGIQTL